MTVETAPSRGWLGRIAAKPKSSVAARLIRGGAWAIGGSVAARAVALFSTIAIARALDVESFGQFAIVQSTANMAAIFAGMGLGVTATKHVAELRLKDAGRLALILATCQRTAVVTGSLVGLLVALLARPTAQYVFANPALEPFIAVSAMGLVFGALDGYQSGILVGLEALKEQAVAATAASVLSLTVIVAMATEWGLGGAVWGSVIGSLLQCTASRMCVRYAAEERTLPPAMASGAFQWPVVIESCLPAMLAGLMVTPAHWICQALLIRHQNGVFEVACLAIAMQWFQAIVFIPTSAGRIVLPVLAESISRERLGTSRRVMIAGICASAVTSLPIIGVVAFAGGHIMSLYGDRFSAAHSTIVFAAAAAGLLAVQSHVGHLVSATGRFWTGLAMNAGWAVTYVSFAWLLLDRGSQGVAVALCLAYLLHATWTSGFAWSWLRSINSAPAQ